MLLKASRADDGGQKSGKKNVRELLSQGWRGGFSKNRGNSMTDAAFEFDKLPSDLETCPRDE